MSEFGEFVEDKCLKFSTRIVNLCRFLNQNKHEHCITEQLIKCGTSIGANVAEAQCAISKNDFAAKLYISLKECNETLYWLKLLKETKMLTIQQYNSINNDCLELKRMLVSITKKVRNTNAD